ncbi:Na+/H+ antiporter NhaA [Sphingobium sp. HBC34]|uniref:Na(+)/H(+) antiporter NhaA n=1 Tax=Sphingobium cyanobacteriorum TaxID=3063954 RepID=A0ABT8ZIC5_9SPHN|nr:Na+/H+ antiporter NhaA [Sphingobium sp. HBC34]MDO7833530.1 Na+/H+ antiporter NhaA [Sphingobium sp. HBC34]
MLKSTLLPRPPSALRDFLRMEASGGLCLIGAAVLAMIVANSPVAPLYFAVLHMRIGPLSALHWIDDGLMSLFFLLVGLEIKREFVEGRLARWSDRSLPVIAAVAGMVVPAAAYLAIAGGQPGLAKGWAIPAATDIAFAIGVLALLGKRAPTSLKLLLTTVAIVDDMGAVLIIALAYTAGVGLWALVAAALIWGVMLFANRRGITSLGIYLVLAAGLWLAVLLSGVHATIAGVLAALAIPIRSATGGGDEAQSPLHRLEHGLHPWVAFGIVPLFGFANAGVSLAGVGLADVLEPLPLGIAAGLFLGKQIGIFCSIRGAVALGMAERPAGANWLQIYGLALLCGIGFTMSLFIGGLAFADPHHADAVKIGVLGGSLLSALAGYGVLRLAPDRRRP